MVKVFIDPGHGGKDPGAVGNGLKEKDLTLKISKKIQDKLSDYENVDVKLSRTGDTFPSLNDRTNAANAWKADYFLSVHINAGGGTGFESLRYTKIAPNTATGRAQSAIHESILNEIKEYDVKDRGQKAADLHVVRESNMKALLTETLFIDRKEDAELLKKDAFLDAIAEGHVKGLASTLGLNKKKASDDNYTIKKGDTFWGIESDLKLKHGTLEKLNPKVDPKALKIGQKIEVK